MEVKKLATEPEVESREVESGRRGGRGERGQRRAN
jgi:hypothetical protein